MDHIQNDYLYIYLPKDVLFASKFGGYKATVHIIV